MTCLSSISLHGIRTWLNENTNDISTMDIPNMITIFQKYFQIYDINSKNQIIKNLSFKKITSI